MGAGFSSDEEEEYRRRYVRTGHPQQQIPPVRTRAPAQPAYYQPQATVKPPNIVNTAQPAAHGPMQAPIVYFHAPPGTRVLYTAPAGAPTPTAPQQPGGAPPTMTNMPPNSAAPHLATNVSVQGASVIPPPSQPQAQNVQPLMTNVAPGQAAPPPTSTNVPLHGAPLAQVVLPGQQQFATVPQQLLATNGAPIAPAGAPQQMMMYYVKTPGYDAPLAIPIPVGQPGPVHVRIERPRREASLLDPFFWGLDSDSDDEYYPARRQARRQPMPQQQHQHAPAPTRPTDTVVPIGINPPEKPPVVSQTGETHVIENYIQPEPVAPVRIPEPTITPSMPLLSSLPDAPAAASSDPILLPPHEVSFGIKDRSDEDSKPAKSLKLRSAKPPSEFALHEEL